jgi:hypothetical protein
MIIGSRSIDIEDVSFIDKIQEEYELVYNEKTKSYEDKYTYYLPIILKSGVQIDIDDNIQNLKKYKKELDDALLEKY